MDLGNIMLTEKPETKGQILYHSIYVNYPEQANL